MTTSVGVEINFAPKLLPIASRSFSIEIGQSEWPSADDDWPNSGIEQKGVPKVN